MEIVSRRLLPIVFQSPLVAVSTGKLHTRRVLSRIGLASSLFFNGSSACCLFNNVLDHARPVDAAVCYGMSTPMLVWVGVKDWQGGDEKASLLVDSEAGLLRHGLPLIFQCWYTRRHDVPDWFSGGGSCWIARIRCFSPYSITRQRAGISPSPIEKDPQPTSIDLFPGPSSTLLPAKICFLPPSQGRHGKLHRAETRIYIE